MATLTEAMVYTKDDETVTVPAKLFVDLVEACGWIQGFCADIKQKAEDWIAQNWRPIDKGETEF